MIIQLFPDCRNKDEDYKQLSQRIFELENRLNLTIQENVDLRTRVDILQQDEEKENFQEKSSTRHRCVILLVHNFTSRWRLPKFQLNLYFFQAQVAPQIRGVIVVLKV